MRAFAFIALLLIAVSFAQQGILVEANKMEYEKNTITYLGNVKATRGQSLLKADKLIVYLDENKKANKIEAVGNVSYLEGNRRGKAERAEYDLKTEIITLIGNARVEEGSNFVEGDEIIYYKREERAIAIGKNSRVRSFYVEEKNEKVRNSK